MKDYIKLHLIVVILGFTAILGRLTEASILDIVFYRTLLASGGMWLLASFQKKDLSLPFNKMLPLLGVGALMTLHWFCFFGSARMATVAVSLVTFSTTSFFTSILEPITKRQIISWIEVFLGILVVVGMYFVFKFEGQYLNGILVGLVGAFLASVFSVMNAHLSHKYEAQTVTFYEMFGAFLSTIIYIPIMLYFIKDLDFKFALSASDWLWIGILGLVCTVYPYNEMMKLLKKFSAFTLNLSINMEPIYGIILAFLIFGENEKMTGGFYIGGLLILASVFLHPLLKNIGKKNLK